MKEDQAIALLSLSTTASSLRGKNLKISKMSAEFPYWNSRHPNPPPQKKKILFTIRKPGDHLVNTCRGGQGEGVVLTSGIFSRTCSHDIMKCSFQNQKKVHKNRIASGFMPFSETSQTTSITALVLASGSSYLPSSLMHSPLPTLSLSSAF